MDDSEREDDGTSEQDTDTRFDRFLSDSQEDDEDDDSTQGFVRGGGETESESAAGENGGRFRDVAFGRDEHATEEREQAQSGDGESGDEAQSQLGQLRHREELANVLVVESRDVTQREAVCSALLDVAEQPQNIVIMNAGGDPFDRLRNYQKQFDRPAGNVGIVDIGAESNTEKHNATLTSDSLGYSVETRSVSAVSDLSRIGIMTSQLLEDMQETGYPTAVCFDSLTPILQQVGTENMFQFLFTFKNSLSEDAVMSHYHLDHDAHDEQAVLTLRRIFDNVIEISEDGLEMTFSTS